MKLFILAILAFLVTGAFAGVRAQRVEVQIGHEKRVANNSISLKFVDMIEDSRCPTDTQPSPTLARPEAPAMLASPASWQRKTLGPHSSRAG